MGPQRRRRENPGCLPGGFPRRLRIVAAQSGGVRAETVDVRDSGREIRLGVLGALAHSVSGAVVGGMFPDGAEPPPGVNGGALLLAAPPGGASTKVGPVRAAATGVALGLSNPQAIVFYVALLPAVITPGTGAGVYVILAVVLCVVMTAVSAVYITLGSRARHTAVSPTARRRANRVAGSLLISSGVLVAIR